MEPDTSVDSTTTEAAKAPGQPTTSDPMRRVWIKNMSTEYLRYLVSMAKHNGGKARAAAIGGLEYTREELEKELARRPVHANRAQRRAHMRRNKKLARRPESAEGTPESPQAPQETTAAPEPESVEEPAS